MAQTPYKGRLRQWLAVEQDLFGSMKNRQHGIRSKRNVGEEMPVEDAFNALVQRGKVVKRGGVKLVTVVSCRIVVFRHGCRPRWPLELAVFMSARACP